MKTIILLFVLCVLSFGQAVETGVMLASQHEINIKQVTYGIGIPLNNSLSYLTMYVGERPGIRLDYLVMERIFYVGMAYKFKTTRVGYVQYNFGAQILSYIRIGISIDQLKHGDGAALEFAILLPNMRSKR